MQRCKHKHTRDSSVYYLTAPPKVENKRNNINFHHFIFGYVLLLVVALYGGCCSGCYYFEFSFTFGVLMRWENTHTLTPIHVWSKLTKKQLDLLWFVFGYHIRKSEKRKLLFRSPSNAWNESSLCRVCWNVTMARTKKASQELRAQYTECVHNTTATDYDSNSRNQVTSCANVLRFDHNSYAYPSTVCVCLWVCESEQATVCWTVVYRNNVLLLC